MGEEPFRIFSMIGDPGRQFTKARPISCATGFVYPELIRYSGAVEVQKETPFRNIAAVVDAGLCTGCGTCAFLCKIHAVRMQKSESLGTQIPTVNVQLCTMCGTCLKACPGHSVHLDELNCARFGESPIHSNIGRVKCVLTGYSSDLNIRMSSSSGGLVTSLLVFALDAGIIDGALVTKMSESSPLEPVVFLAKTRKDILSSARSKYCPVPLNSALGELLDKPGRYAVVGLPCHVHGICKAMEMVPELQKRIAYVFGLACDHTPTYNATEYLLKRIDIPKHNVARISYRGGGWPGVLTLEMHDGSTMVVPHGSIPYWGFVFQRFFFPLRCGVCIDKTCELSDVSFMDAWLPRFSSDKLGVSLMVVRTDSAVSLIDRAAQSGVIDIQPAEENDVVNSQSVHRVMRRRSAMISLFSRLGRPVPDYGRPLPDTTMEDLVAARLLHLRTTISSKRRFWFAISIYEKLWRLQRIARRQEK